MDHVMWQTAGIITTLVIVIFSAGVSWGRLKSYGGKLDRLREDQKLLFTKIGKINLILMALAMKVGNPGHDDEIVKMVKSLGDNGGG